MGIKNVKFDKLKPTHEVPDEVLELVRMSVLETLQADFYHTEDKHVEAAIELHKNVAGKYPNFYLDIYADKEFFGYFLDAHRLLSMPFLLQDEQNVDIVLDNLTKLQPDRLAQAFMLCRMEETFGARVSKKVLRNLFELVAKHIENEKGSDYVGFMGVKYARTLHDLMALIRTKREKLSPVWGEVMDWAFERELKSYSTDAMKEAARLRKLVKEGKEPPKSMRPKAVPFTIWEGYARALGVKERDIFKHYKLMTKNEVRRNLATLQKHGILESAHHKRKVQEKVMKTEADLLQLVYGLKVIDKDAEKILMKKGNEEFERCVKELRPALGKKKVSIAIDASGGGMGHVNMLDPEMQKKVAKGEKVPKWANIVIRETFNANVLIAKVLEEASKKATVYAFNEVVMETELPGTFEELVEELKELKCGGGSNVLDAVENAITDDSDIVFIITDLNENIPFQGALKAKLEELARKFRGTIIFVLTETALERPEAVNLDDIIREKKLTNVMLMPVNKLRHLVRGFKLLDLFERAKKKFIETEIKKKKKVKA